MNTLLAITLYQIYRDGYEQNPDTKAYLRKLDRRAHDEIYYQKGRDEIF